MSHFISRADLINCISAGIREDIYQWAELFGFVQIKQTAISLPENIVTEFGVTETLSVNAEQPIVNNKSSISLICNTKHKLLKSIKPEKKINEEILTDKDISANGQIPFPPLLVQKARLHPVVNDALSINRQSIIPDIIKITSIITNQRPLLKLPYINKRRQAHDKIVIYDSRFHLQFVLIDQLRVINSLRKTFFINKRNLIEIKDEPLEKYLLLINKSVIPDSCIIMFSDLGCLRGDCTEMKFWFKTGMELRKRGIKLTAIVPCPENRIPKPLRILWNVFIWDKGIRNKKRNGHYRLSVASFANYSNTENFITACHKAEFLLSLLSPCVYIEGALVRSLRYKLGKKYGDIGTECDVWNHIAVSNYYDPLGFSIQPGELEKYQNKYSKCQKEIESEHDMVDFIEKNQNRLPPVIMAFQIMSAKILCQISENVIIDENDEVLFTKVLNYLKSKDGSQKSKIEISEWFIKILSKHKFSKIFQSSVISALWLNVDIENITRTLPKNFNSEAFSLISDKEPQEQLLKIYQRGMNLWFTTEAIDIKKDPAVINRNGYGTCIGTIKASDNGVIVQTTDKSTSENLKTLLLTDDYFTQSVPVNSIVSIESEFEKKTFTKITKPSWATAFGYDKYGMFADFTIKGIVQKMRWIPPGTFMMGSPESEPLRFAKETHHQVTLTEGFWLADTVCTQALWEKVIGKNPSGFKGYAELPVENISWLDCELFLKKLNSELKDNKFCFPTEAQWEYACRAGTTSPFWFGNKLTTKNANCNRESPNVIQKKGEYQKKTVHVKSFNPNPWGLYQMYGNVWEWCADWYNWTLKEDATNPKGPDYGAVRVLRGGSWRTNGGYLRSAYRHSSEQFGNRRCDIGFRLSRGQ